MKVIIHAGPAKTGSSSIQAFLRANRVALLEQGILFPETPISGHHGAYLSLIWSDQRVGNAGFANPPGHSAPIHADKIRRICQSALERDAERVRNFSPESVVLSAEHFTSLRGQELKDFLRLVARYFPGQTEFVFYVRNPVQWMASRHLQTLKRGVLSLGGGWGRPLFGVRRQVADISQLTGQRPSVFHYSRALFPGGDINRQFVSEILSVSSPESLTYPADRNASISAELGLLLAEMRLKEFAELPFSSRPKKINDLRNVLAFWEAVNGAPKGIYKPLVQDHILRKSHEDLVWLQAEYGIELQNNARYLQAGKAEPFELSPTGNLTAPELVRMLFEIDESHLDKLKAQARTLEKRSVCRFSGKILRAVRSLLTRQK